MDEPLFRNLKLEQALHRWDLFETLIEDGIDSVRLRVKGERDPRAAADGFYARLQLWEDLAMEDSDDLFLICEVTRILHMANAVYERHSELIDALRSSRDAGPTGNRRWHLAVAQKAAGATLRTEAQLDCFDDEVEALLGRLQQLYQRFDWFPQGRPRSHDRQQPPAGPAPSRLRSGRRRWRL